jgi:hypothetical protein
MAENTWPIYERPILEAIHRLEDNGTLRQRGIELAPDFAAELKLDEGKVRRTIAALIDAKYLTGEDVTGMRDPDPIFMVTGLTERGRREVGQWPSEDSVAALLAALDKRIDETPDPVEKSKLQKMRDAAASMARDVLVGVLTDVARGSI